MKRIAYSVLLAIAFSACAFVFFKLEELFSAKPANYLDEFAKLLFSNLAKIFMGYALLYPQEAWLKPLLHRYAPDGPAGTATQAVAAATPAQKRLPIILSIVLLTLLWEGYSLYCQLLFLAVHAAFTDPSIVNADIPAQVVQDLQITLRGTLYLGTFFPIVTLTSLVSGFLAKKPLTYWQVLIPAFITYGTLRILPLLGITSYTVNPEALTTPAATGSQPAAHVAVGSVQSLFAFVGVGASLALYGYLFILLGYGFSKLYERIARRWKAGAVAGS